MSPYSAASILSARGYAEQIRVAQRVPEDALIRGSGDREHPADERGERDPGRSQLPEHRMVDRSERLVHVQEREGRERRAEDRADADVDRPDREPDRDRHDEEGDGDEAGTEADTPRLDARCRLRSAGRRGHQPCLAIRATDRANCTIRGPQREATSSSAP